MILVTGGTGLLGSHLIAQLLIEGAKVRAVHRPNSNLEKLAHAFTYVGKKFDDYASQLEWYASDLLDVYTLEGGFKDVTEVYHCAAIVSFDKQNAEELLFANPEATANMVNLSLRYGIRKMIYVSSVAAIGRAKEGVPITEETPWQNSSNNSVYARSKYRAELEVWRGIQEGLIAAIVNPSIILGPGNWEKGSSAIFNKIAKGFSYYSSGTNAYVDVRDVVEIMQQLMHSDIKESRFIIAAENISYKNLFAEIAESLDLKVRWKEVKPWMSGLLWRLEVLRSRITGKQAVITKETAHTAYRKYHYQNTKIKEALGFEFIPLKQTIKDLAHHYKNSEIG